MTILLQVTKKERKKNRRNLNKKKKINEKKSVWDKYNQQIKPKQKSITADYEKGR